LLALWPDCWAGADGGSGLRAILGKTPGVGVGPDGGVGVGTTTGAMPYCGPDGGLGLVGISRALTPLEWPRPIHMTSAARTRPAKIIMRRQIRDWSEAISCIVMLTPQTWAGVSDLGRCLLNRESLCRDVASEQVKLLAE
jgi:hypothetical protein